VLNAGSIADAAQLLIEAVPAGCFCAGCEAIVTAAEGCGESPTWCTISQELRHGRELPLLSLQLA
jgi:Zn finger protein HypA/HybF involved in hydrogenase expression